MNQKTNKFSGKSILGIDFGSKNVGLAYFCPGREPYPMPYGQIVNTGESELIEKLAAIILEESIEVIILGLPLLTDGTESSMTRKVKKFQAKIKEAFPNIEHYFQDETLSTKAAEEVMLSSPIYNFKIDKSKIDALSATIILEDFMKS